MSQGSAKDKSLEVIQNLENIKQDNYEIENLLVQILKELKDLNKTLKKIYQ